MLHHGVLGYLLGAGVARRQGKGAKGGQEKSGPCGQCSHAWTKAASQGGCWGHWIRGSAVTPGLGGRVETKNNSPLLYFLLPRTRFSQTQRQGVGPACWYLFDKGLGTCAVGATAAGAEGLGGGRRVLRGGGGGMLELSGETLGQRNQRT